MSKWTENLNFGKAGESAIACWLRSIGRCVIPVYEKIIDEGKGPQLFLPDCELIAPDLLSVIGPKISWVEAKHKSAFSVYRNSGKLTTGIDLRHYLDYLEVAQRTPWPVWLLFLHEGGTAKGDTRPTPSGLFGNNLLFLKEHEHHRWDSPAMVYWEITSLLRLATAEEVFSARARFRPCLDSSPRQ